ncbi:unnamed protein product [Amoebophrya sp. A25]|nr:unnamed protein product [Amoebophrya sp. A25]|eukprot:GSA25T00006387001.1
MWLPMRKLNIREMFATYDGRIPHATAPFFEKNIGNKQKDPKHPLHGIDLKGRIPIDKEDLVYQFSVDNYTVMVPLSEPTYLLM